jgi:hypothetical protein
MSATSTSRAGPDQRCCRSSDITTWTRESVIARWPRERNRSRDASTTRCFVGWPPSAGSSCPKMAAGHLDGWKQRTSRSLRIGAVPLAVCLVLVGCTSGASKTPSGNSSPSKSGNSSTPGSIAKLIQPPGPISAHPALLDEANTACKTAGAADLTLCAGTVDAEVWGLPLVIMSQLRDLLACQIRVTSSTTQRRWLVP